jgi:hypothetical protein
MRHALAAAVCSSWLSLASQAAECSADCSSGQCRIQLHHRDEAQPVRSDVSGDGEFVLAGAERGVFEDGLRAFAEQALADVELQERMGNTAKRYLADVQKALQNEDWQRLVELRRQLRAFVGSYDPEPVRLSVQSLSDAGAFCGCSAEGQPNCERI